jgi:hypothetical protein
MKNLIVLHEDFGKEEPITLYIDPSFVTYVRKAILNDNTYIHFSDGHSITVTENINYVYQKIWEIN